MLPNKSIAPENEKNPTIFRAEVWCVPQVHGHVGSFSQIYLLRWSTFQNPSGIYPLVLSNMAGWKMDRKKSVLSLV